MVPRTKPWLPSLGDLVELRHTHSGATVRAGRVEILMPDGTGFWLAADGPDERRYVHIDDENLEIWA